MTRNSYVKDYADGTRKRMGGYFCLNGIGKKTDVCPISNRISYIELTDVLFSLFKGEFAVNLKKQKTYVETAREIIKQKKLEVERKLRTIAYTIERLNEEESGKYMAYRRGDIVQKEYVAYKLQKEVRSRELEKQECQFKEQASSLERDGEHYLKAVRSLIKLKSEQTLTKELIETLIEKIYVYPGKRIEVLFSYSDALMEVQNDRR